MSLDTLPPELLMLPSLELCQRRRYLLASSLGSYSSFYSQGRTFSKVKNSHPLFTLPRLLRRFKTYSRISYDPLNLCESLVPKVLSPSSSRRAFFNKLVQRLPGKQVLKNSQSESFSNFVLFSSCSCQEFLQSSQLSLKSFSTLALFLPLLLSCLCVLSTCLLRLSQNCCVQ
ncbi:hypothetical protein VTK56DRAFT_7763 [Thermocarpiscus australiensis]